MNIKTESFEIDVVERINQLEREVSGQGAKLDAIKDSIARLANNVDRPTNWVGIGSLLIGMFGITMAFLSLVTSGIQVQTTTHSELLSVLTPKVYEDSVVLEHMVSDKRDTDRDIKKLMVQMGKLDGFLKFEGQKE